MIITGRKIAFALMERAAPLSRPIPMVFNQDGDVYQE
jgi:hypothetical protein